MPIRLLRWRRAARPAMLCGALCLLLSCAMGGPPASPMPHTLIAPPANEARLVFFRERGYFGSLVSKDIKIDDKPAGSLSNGSYFVTHHAAGRVRVTVVNDLLSPDYHFSFEVEGGKTYYLELHANASMEDGAPTAALLQAKHPDFCGPGWCTGREDAAEALPKLRKLGLVVAPH